MRIGPFEIKRIRKDQKKHYAGPRSGYGNRTGMARYGGIYNQPIFRLLHDCSSGVIGETPRARLEVYRALDETVPILWQARELFKFAIGKMELTSEDPRLKEVLQTFDQDFAIRNESQSEFDFYSGLHNYALDLFEYADRDGMSFGELTRQGGSRSEVNGVISRDAALFEFMSMDGGRTVDLYFYSIDGQIKIENSSNFIGYSNKQDPRFWWGVPTGYGTEKAHEDFLKRVIAHQGTMLRIGYPPTIHMLTPEVEDIEMSPWLRNQIEGELPDNSDSLENRLSNAWGDGMDHFAKTGKSFELWATAAKMKYTPFVHGTGLPLPSDYPEEYQMLLSTIARRTGAPLVLLDFVNGGSGIGSDRFRVAIDQLISGAENKRSRIEKPIKKIVDAFLVSIGAPPSSFNNYSINWKVPSLENFKEKAEAMKIEAEAVATQWATRNEMSANNANDAADSYAEELGREEWKGDRID